MSINTFIQPAYLQDLNIGLLVGGNTKSEMHKSQMSIYSSKLKGLPNKNKLNGVYRVYMQLCYSWMNSFVRKKISGVKSISLPKLKGLLYKQLGRLYMQLSYSRLNSFLEKKSVEHDPLLAKIEWLAI